MNAEIESRLTELRNAGDFVRFEDKDDYVKYFNVLDRALNMLAEWFRRERSQDSNETWAFQPFIDRLLFTVGVLEMKHLHEPSHNMVMDLNESGFPHFVAIQDLESDLRIKPELLSRLESPERLRGNLLDHLIEQGEDDERLVWDIAKRRYLELIDEGRLYLQFTPGNLRQMTDRETRNGRRSFIVTWANYDRNTNLPYLHAMVLEQDESEEPIDKNNDAQQEFFKVLSQEGSRAPAINQLASVIDRRIPSIHPKLLQRICIGPLYAPSASIGGDDILVNQFLKDFGEPNDFALCFTVEKAISTSEREVKSGLFKEKIVTEIFHVHPTDQDLRKRQASSAHHYLMIPHDVLQEMPCEKGGEFESWRKHKKLTFNSKGDLDDF